MTPRPTSLRRKGERVEGQGSRVEGQTGATRKSRWLHACIAQKFHLAAIRRERHGAGRRLYAKKAGG